MKLVALKLSEQQKKADFRRAIKRMCPVPVSQLQRKFMFFYGPYNYTCNTKKYMTFDDDAGSSGD
jgi:hypothetical protein